MKLIYCDPLFKLHGSEDHPEKPQRIDSALQSLANLSGIGQRMNPVILDQTLLNPVHSAQQITGVLNWTGCGYLDPDTYLSEHSVETALYAAGTVVDAAKRIVAGEAANALCLIRPPGHHATEKRSMGFCLFNNVAVATQYCIDHLGIERILVIDWDVHHGNGTQDIFYQNDRVFFYSIHRFPFYPGSGDHHETGTGRGLGYTLNMPMEFGTSRMDYLAAFDWGLDKAAAKIKPQLIIISAGFDAHKDDPVGSLGLESQDYRSMTKKVKAVADHYCQGRILSCLEGGYNLKALTASISEHLTELSGQKPNEP